jgi:hypothetical protein
MVRSISDDTVQARIAQALVQALHIDLGSHQALLAFFSATLHLVPKTEVLLDRVIAVLGLDTVHTSLLHLFVWSCINVRLSTLEDLSTPCKECVKVVTEPPSSSSPSSVSESVESLIHVIELFGSIPRVRYGEWMNTDLCQILLDAIDILDLLFGRIGIIKAQNHLALILLCQSPIQQSGLDMADMQVTRRLWRESGDDLTIDSVCQLDVGEVTSMTQTRRRRCNLATGMLLVSSLLGLGLRRCRGRCASSSTSGTIKVLGRDCQ